MWTASGLCVSDVRRAFVFSKKGSKRATYPWRWQSIYSVVYNVHTDRTNAQCHAKPAKRIKTTVSAFMPHAAE
jgi:hypothetical protein